MSGSNTTNKLGVYGTKGTFSPVNVPGARYHHTVVIHPYNNNMVMYGGYSTSI
jgi:hypothetical protein